MKNVLLIELRKAGLKSEYQKPIIVHYEGEVVGKFYAGDDTGTNVGFLLNFGEGR